MKIVPTESFNYVYKNIYIPVANRLSLVIAAALCFLAKLYASIPFSFTASPTKMEDKKEEPTKKEEEKTETTPENKLAIILVPTQKISLPKTDFNFISSFMKVFIQSQFKPSLSREIFQSPTVNQDLLDQLTKTK